MSDPFTARLQQLRDQPPPRPFAPPQAIRRRGRQRTRRRIAAVAVLTSLAVAGAVLAFASVRPNRPPEPGTSPHPSATTTAPSPSATGRVSPGPSRLAPTAVLPGQLLQTADLPPGTWNPAGSELFEGADKWYWADACPDYRSADYPSLRHQRDVGAVSYASGSRRVNEIVEVYQSGWGPGNLTDVRSLLATCAGRPPSPGSRETPAPTVRTVIGSDLAGDESLLVRVDQYYFEGETIASTPFVILVAVVRVGDLVATVQLPGPGTRDEADALATAAAARLATR